LDVFTRVLGKTRVSEQRKAPRKEDLLSPERKQDRRDGEPAKDQPKRKAEEVFENQPTEPEPELIPRERREVQRRTTVRAHVVHEAIRAEGEDELKRPPAALWWSGLAAGLSMGFSMATMGLLQAGLPDAPWAPLVSSLGYTIGFLIVILGRQQLFTENTLTVVLPLFRRRNWLTLRLVARLWFIVLVANLLGALIFALGATLTNAFPEGVADAFSAIGHHAIQGSFLDTFFGAVLAGWLIALMVWLMPSADTARVTIIVIITYVVALGGFAHIIAGSVETLYIMVSGEIGPLRYLWDFFLPTLTGNVIGGVALVATLNHAQVIAGSREDNDQGQDRKKRG